MTVTQTSMEDLTDRVVRLERLVAALLNRGRYGTRRLAGYAESYRHREPPLPSGDSIKEVILDLLIDEESARIHETIEFLEKDFKLASEKSASITEYLHTWLSIFSLGAFSDAAPLIRFIPVRIYLSEGKRWPTPREPARERPIMQAVLKMLNEYDFEVAHELPAAYSSWFKKLFAKTSDVVSKPEVSDRLEKIEKALELRGLDQPQADVDKKYLDGVSNLIASISEVGSVTLQIGSLLLLKTTNDHGSEIRIRKLSNDQLLALERNQTWLKSPVSLLEKLDSAKL